MAQLLRKAIMGSILDARRAGTYPAISATALSNRIIVANVTGSIGEVPNNSVEIRRATPTDARNPTSMPIKVSVSVFEITPS